MLLRYHFQQDIGEEAPTSYWHYKIVQAKEYIFNEDLGLGQMGCEEILPFAEWSIVVDSAKYAVNRNGW